MNHTIKNLIGNLIAGVMIIVILSIPLSAIAGVVYLVKSTTCESRWENSDRKYEYGLLSGCLVADKNGNLIPEKNIRDID